MAAQQRSGSDDRLLLNWSHPRSVSVGDTDVSVHLGGRGAPVLILPGFPCSPRSFLPIAEALAKDHYVILPYLPGTGPSHRPATGGYSIQQTAVRMWNLCEALGARNVQIVGHGLGGAVAYWLAAHHLQRIHRMVVLSAPLRGISPRWVLGSVQRGFPVVADLLFRAAGPAIVRRTYQQLVGPGHAVTPEEQEHAVATWAPEGRRGIAVSYYRALRNVMAFRFFRDAWIKVPTVLIFGDSARSIPEPTIQASVDAIDKVRVKVLAGVGHCPHLERPDEVTTLVTAFLSTQRRGKAGTESMGRPLD